MLTSVKDALNNERYYDAVSNNINSTITMYSNIDELQKESKVFVEDAYKPLRCNVNVMTKTATESLNLLVKLSEKILPSFNKIDGMRSSFSTEGAFTNFLELAYIDAHEYTEELIIKIINLYKSIVDICSKLEKFIANIYANIKPSSNFAKQLMKYVKAMNVADIPISEFLTKGDPDITVDFIQVNDVRKIIADKFSEYLSFVQMYICKNTDRNYLSRLKEKCSILTNISTDLNKCCKDLLSGIDNYFHDEGKSVKKAIDVFSKNNNKSVDIFFKFMDLEDINLWVRHEYSFIPAYDNYGGDNEFKTIFADKIKETKALNNIIYSQNKSEIDKCKGIEDADIISLASPLTAGDITNKIDGISLSEKKPFNAKDLFGYLTVNEVLEKSSDIASKFELFKTNIQSNNLNYIQKELTKACGINIESLRIYQSSLKNNLSFKDNSNDNLNRSLCIGLMKLFVDINTSVIAMNQLVINDIIKKCVCVTNMNAAINVLLMHIKLTLDKESK